MKSDQETLLAKPFELNEHQFKGRNVYINKSAIRHRLWLVDPQWKLSPPELVTVDGDVVIMRGSLTVCGVTRYQIGSGIIQRKDEAGKVLEGYSLALSITKAYKSAASDILARAAVEFNCGAYLKDVSKDDRPSNLEGLKKLLTKLAAAPVDPNAWIPANIVAWGDKWKAKDLTDVQLLKALGIEGAWLNFKGTIAEADKAVEAFIEINTFLPPATPKAASSAAAASLAKIDCPIHLLEPGDVVIQEYKTSGSGPAVNRHEVIANWGMVAGGRQCKLKIKDLETGAIETVTWTGSTRTLCNGPKVKAFANDPDVCLPGRNGSRPTWDKQIAEPVRV